MLCLRHLNRHILALAILGTTLAGLVACEKSEDVDIGANTTAAPEAFRSVLDGKSRILTVPLHKHLWLAYDTKHAQLYKAWQGDVLLDGPVYTNAHGPQPSSRGQTWEVFDEEPWVLVTPTKQLELAVQYVGYTQLNNQLALMYQFQLPDTGSTVSIEESPAYQAADGGVALVRTFKVTGLPADSVLKLANILELNNGTSSKRQTWLMQEAEQVLTDKTNEKPNDSNHPGLALIEKSDCVSCHNEKLKTVGPSYLSIARRYLDNKNSIQMLSDKIIVGGSGVWGNALMIPHENLPAADAELMVQYILSLDDNDEPTDESSWHLGLKSIPATLSEQLPENKTETSGAYVYLHYFDGDQPSVQKIHKSSPALAAHTPQIHIRDVDDFSVVKEHFAYQILSNLRIKENTSKTIRIVSDDGAYLYLDGERVINNWGFHGPDPMDVTVELSAGDHPLEIIYFQGTGGGAISLQWYNEETDQYELIPEDILISKAENRRDVVPVILDSNVIKSIPGDTLPLTAVHPAFDLYQARPESFKPMVGGIDFFSDGRMLVSTWDAEGSLYIVENYTAKNPDEIKVERIAKGLAEPLGVKVVDDEIYVMQKQELSKLEDRDNDGLIDTFLCISNDWTTTANFHEFGFGLEYADGNFYVSLATAILPGGASAQPQAPDRGKLLRINRQSGDTSMVAHGLRTPNGIGKGINGKFFIADNQGDWLPASKIVEVTEGAFYGSRSVDFEGTEELEETLPVVWLPQDEIGNSPSEPTSLNLGPYQNQMIHGEVTHGGIKRVSAEEVNGRLQGAVFRFSQGLEAGVNRLDWTQDGSLIVGGVGNPGNWSHANRLWYGLQRLEYNGQSAFEMLNVSARSNGFEVTFTEAIKDGQNISADDFQIFQWYYEPTDEYGGPKKDLEELQVKAFSLSDDRKTAHFELPGIKEKHLVYFRITHPFSSQQNHELWTTEAWYTLNAIPKHKPVVINKNYTIKHNTLSSKEIAEGWKLLFDGETTQGIRNYNKQTLGEHWVVNDNALHLEGRGPAESGWQTHDGGDIVISDRPYENYELYLEWKIQKNGNSGIIYNVNESPEFAQPFDTGPEFQILDNKGHADGKIEKHRAGDNYDLISAKFVTVNEAGEWNRARLIVNNGHVQHWLNGYMVVETQMWGPEWENLLANSKFKDWPNFGNTRRGHIVLQDHGDKVWFRNIKVREL